LLVLPSLESPDDIRNNQEVHERRRQAIELGRKLFRKKYLRGWESTSRRVQSDIFSKEFSLLDDILFSVRVGADEIGDKKYGIDKTKYIKLPKLLHLRRELARDSFLYQGIGMPRVPSWGDKFGTDSFLLINDFEVVAVCFRAEIEYFCHGIDKIHDFICERPRGINSDSSNKDDLYEKEHPTESISTFWQRDPSHVRGKEHAGEASLIMIDDHIPVTERKSSDITTIKRLQSAHLRYRDGSKRLSAVHRENKLPSNPKVSEVMQRKNESISTGTKAKNNIGTSSVKNISPLCESAS
jgi:hypothetical protein